MQIYPEDGSVDENSSKEEYIAYLQSLDVPGKTKKYMYIQWCAEHGEDLTYDDVEKFYHHPAG